ncbi:ribonuclease Z [Candidatus Beckwithbacteria bacterium]|nr:ribonuclease Z [Candidatus Beckwithbacteria bacterium]
MKITVLGSGMDASQIPGITNRFPPGYLLEWGKGKILIECPESIRFRLEEIGVDYASIQHLAISHSHPDHYALPQYLQSVWNKGYLTDKNYINHNLNIYGPSSLINKIDELLQFFRPGWLSVLVLPKLILKALPQKSTLIINGLKLSAINVYHGSKDLDSLAFRFEYNKKVIVYSGDTGDCKEIRKISLNADLFLCDCSAPIDNKQILKLNVHLNPKLAGDIAKNSNVKKLVLCHYSGLDSEEKMIKNCRKSGYKEEIIIAKDLQIVEL